MCAAGRLKAADFCEKSPVFLRKHGGFLWKVGDLKFAEGVAVGVGDSGKSKKPNRRSTEVSFCRINAGFLRQNEGRVAVFRSLSEPVVQGLSIAVGKEASGVLGVDFQRTMSGESDRLATKNGSLRGETAVRERALRRFAGRCAADGFISFQKRERCA